MKSWSGYIAFLAVRGTLLRERPDPIEYPSGSRSR